MAHLQVPLVLCRGRKENPGEKIKINQIKNQTHTLQNVTALCILNQWSLTAVFNLYTQCGQQETLLNYVTESNFHYAWPGEGGILTALMSIKPSVQS